MSNIRISRSITKSVDLRVAPEKAYAYLHNLMNWPQWATWTVPARVVPNGDGSTFFMTFFQPPVMDDTGFDAAAKEVEVELKQLKEILEAL